MHFCILDVCHNAALIVVLITYVWSYFIEKLRKAITLDVMRIFRRDKKRRIGHKEENAFIENVISDGDTVCGMWLCFIM